MKESVMANEISLLEAVSRWLDWNNGPLGPNEENYDFELDMRLFKAEAGFLLDLLEVLSTKKLSEQAIANLGAGIAEDFLVNHSKYVKDLEERIVREPKMKEIFLYSWDRDDMPQNSLKFLEKLRNA